MQVTNGNLTARNSAAFAGFANHVLTVDFQQLAKVYDDMLNLTLTYGRRMQEATDASRSAQGEVTRCNNEIARLHERLDLLQRRLDEQKPEPKRRWWQRG